MRGRVGMVVVVAVLGLTPARVAASAGDVAATHAYLVAAYRALHATVTTWPTLEANIRTLDRRFRDECPAVGAGSPQNEEEQKLSYEVAGTLWASSYHTDAKIVQAFVKAVRGLRWSSAAVERSVQRYTAGLVAMTKLAIPDLCADVRAWSAGGYGTVSAATVQFDQRVEAIDVKEVPPKLLARLAKPSDRGLLAKIERLATKYDELEFSRGQDDWNALLEVLALNQ
jgi:hypothetical protein